ncbi:MAG: DUF4190 domain-containing protein [Clostridiales bacterium]|nr:DUF4190 domain-containing protein [Clostridiales bacterium]
MKKNNAFGIIILIAIILAADYLLSAVLAWILGWQDPTLFLIISVLFSMLLFPELVNPAVYPIAKSTMNKNIKKQNFGKTTTFTSRTRHTFKSILCIDEETGRVGYVSLSDPFRFQMANPGDLSKIRSTIGSVARGGTRFVFFEFYCGDNRMRFPIFKAGRHGLDMVVNPNIVQDSLDEGSRICNLLLRFNPGGNDFSINRNIPFSKTGECGFIFSLISIHVTVVALMSEFIIAASHAESLSFDAFILSYVLILIATVLAITGLVLGIKAIKDARVSPVRGKGYAKAAVIIPSILLVILIGSLLLLLKGLGSVS